MSTYAHPAPAQQNIGGGFVGAVVLHIAVFAALIGAALLHPENTTRWGENATSVGAIQASMVSSIPLPPKAPPVEKSVLTEENVTKAPAVQQKETTVAPPRPTDLLIKDKTAKNPKLAEKVVQEAVKHPQPVPDTPKAATGAAATQLAQSVTQVTNGTATTSVQDRAFGTRYAYYLRIVGNAVSQNWYKQEADPGASQGKSATLLFDIQRDGTVANLRIETRSGSVSLDQSTMRAVQRIESFGPLPGNGDRVTVEYKFDYHNP